MWVHLCLPRVYNFIFQLKWSSTFIAGNQAVGSSYRPSFIAMATRLHCHGYLGATCNCQCVS